MGNPILNSLEIYNFCAFRDLKKEHPDPVDLLVDKNNVGGMAVTYKQAIGKNQKNSEQNAHYFFCQARPEAGGAHTILNILRIIDNREHKITGVLNSLLWYYTRSGATYAISKYLYAHP